MRVEYGTFRLYSGEGKTQDGVCMCVCVFVCVCADHTFSLV
jgi:hypothetical protein